jgi:nitroreductase
MDKPIHPATQRRILEAAWLTGSSMNRQPWNFILVEDRGILQALGSLASTGYYIAQSAIAVVVVIERTPFSVSDASRAIQSMMMTAWSEGVGSNWVGFFGLDAVKPVLGVPEALDILAIVPFGYPVKKIGLGKKKRKPFSEVVHRERYGQPFQ